jgi:hypothetical protein
MLHKIGRHRSYVSPAALTLLGAGLALLWAGHFFSWDDPEGFQSERWNYTDGSLAALFASGGGLLSLFDRTARRQAGMVVGGFVALLAVLEVVAPHLDFAGADDSSGLVVWEVLLGMAAFVLLTPHWTRVGEPWERRPGRRRLTGWARCSTYVVASPIVAVAAFGLAGAIATRGHPECNQPGDACAAAYAGFFFGLMAFAAIVVIVSVTEVARAVARSRRRRRWETDSRG